jgi:hypothetical protein
MGQIYSCAFMVMVWLGETSDNTEKVEEALKWLDLQKWDVRLKDARTEDAKLAVFEQNFASGECYTSPGRSVRC